MNCGSVSDQCGVKDFQEALRNEREALGKPGATECLTGLTFSGGGIRSATFNLGVIQALAGKNLLGKFDYLSTVSGGGYIGSWFSAQIHRQAANAEGFQNSLNASTAAGAEADSIQWLRSYSNYLTPKKGLSGDTLTAIGTWLRNTAQPGLASPVFRDAYPAAATGAVEKNMPEDIRCTQKPTPAFRTRPQLTSFSTKRSLKATAISGVPSWVMC
jgi:predicted acylesterase/phospholipase RssA